MKFILVPASHHKKHKGNNVKVEEYGTTFFSNEGDSTDSGGDDFVWPEPSVIRNFHLPADFDFGKTKNSVTEVCLASSFPS